MARTVPPKPAAATPTPPISRRTRPPAPVTTKPQGTPKAAPSGRRVGTPRQTDAVLTEFTKHHINWGGHMPFVEPEDCSHKRLFKQQQPDGVVFWIDNGICRGGFCPNGNAHCDRYWQYWKKGGKEEHNAFVENKYHSKKEEEEE